MSSMKLPKVDNGKDQVVLPDDAGGLAPTHDVAEDTFFSHHSSNKLFLLKVGFRKDSKSAPTCAAKKTGEQICNVFTLSGAELPFLGKADRENAFLKPKREQMSRDLFNTLLGARGTPC